MYGEAKGVYICSQSDPERRCVKRVRFNSAIGRNRGEEVRYSKV